MQKVNFCADAQEFRWDNPDRESYLVTALFALLLALDEHRTEMAVYWEDSPMPRQENIYCMADMDKWPAPGCVAGDPVEWGIKKAIRAVGKEAHTRGGIKAMQTLCSAAEDKFGLGVVGIIDHAFDGIGDWYA